jgi:hypothetical protein
MSQTTDRRLEGRPVPDAVEVERPRPRLATGIRALGALALAAVGAVHLEQYVAVHYHVIPVIGPLFLLNFVGSAAVALLLLLPTGRIRPLGALLALGGIAIAVPSFVFLLISEHRQLFGFEEYGYRTAVVVALVLEAAAAILLAAYVSLLARER